MELLVAVMFFATSLALFWGAQKAKSLPVSRFFRVMSLLLFFLMIGAGTRPTMAWILAPLGRYVMQAGLASLVIVLLAGGFRFQQQRF